MLLKYYDNYEGEVMIGEKSLHQYSEEEARQFFSVVAQENHFFNDTIRSNSSLANPNATDEQMKKVLEDVSLTQISLEDRMSEKGLSLSGGERQRLAIARMILKRCSYFIT
ncbi:ATP-binding cassette domain-containing protein [Anaerobacillus sp. HL2]|nr:ATP-binding cassette domain-containing protein [Anaerobacillus sp. HL2]